MTKGEAKRGYRKAAADAMRARKKAVALAAKLVDAKTIPAREKLLVSLENARHEANAHEEQAKSFFSELRRLTE